jgi:REP element-mobilizing transposase RayT
MARPLRLLIPDGWYHVFGRGWERRDIFRDDRDREHFLELLGELRERYRFRIHAYALMGNHHHLIVQTPDANLSRGMQWFNTSYSAWFNARHDRVGALWQGRYRDVVIENSAWAYALSTYVHLNPLRISGLGLDKNGRLVEGKGFRVPSPEQVTERLTQLRAYRWSSYRAYAGYCPTPTWLTTSELLGRAHTEPSRRRAAYRSELKARLTQGQRESRAERLRDAIAIGSASFARRIRKEADEDDEGLAKRRELRRRATVEEVRSQVEALRGQRWGDFADVRGDWGRPLFLWGLRKRCGMTLREAGEAAGGMKPAAVDQALRRLEQRAEANPAIRDTQTELLRLLDS